MALLDEQPYVGYPQMGRRRAMPNRDVEMNQGLLRGASYYPTDLLGSPVDLINMALKPMGLGSQKPVMGSDYLQSLAQQYGLSQQPTGSNAENVARLAMSAMNPATGARAVGRAIEPTMQALAPKAYGLLEDYMVKSGGMIPLTAYHGTPHNIQGKFDISKMGTGEGNQAYGPGIYFAENPLVSKEYQKITQGPESAAQSYLEMFKTPERAISALAEGLRPNLTPEAKKFTQDAIDVLKSGKELKGNLYKVDIPDKDIPNMLDWDKPLSKMTEKESNILTPVLNKLVESNNPYHPEQGFKTVGDVIQFGMLNNPNLRNDLLAEGIPGIKYLDASSRVAGKGTSNYVVFDPTDVKILEKNDQLIEGLLD